MTVIYLTENDKSSAEAHASSYGEKIQSMDEMLEYEASEITLSSHTNPWITGFGKLSPAMLAEKIAANYLGEKHKLEHLYLLTCAGGLSVNKQPCLAKKLTQALFERGFTALKVHAPTTPHDIPAEDMILEVIFKSSVIRQVGNISITISPSLAAHRLDQAITFLEEHNWIKRSISFFSPHFANHHTQLVAFRNQNLMFRRTEIMYMPDGEYKNILRNPQYTFTANSDPVPYNSFYAFATMSLYRNKTTSKDFHKQFQNAIEFMNSDPDTDFEALKDWLRKNRLPWTPSDRDEELYGPIDEGQFLTSLVFSMETITAASAAALPEHIQTILNDVEEKMRMCYFSPIYSSSPEQLIFQLQEYIKLRSAQSEYCSVSFLNGFSIIVEWISNALFYILNEHQSKTVKINTAEHLIAKLQGRSHEEFSLIEKKALANGQLGKIIEYTHPSLTLGLKI